MYVSPLHTAHCLNREISQIIRFFETQNQSTLVLTQNIPSRFSSRLGSNERNWVVVKAMSNTDYAYAIVFNEEINEQPVACFA
ncbi:hypothetical protein NIES2107_50480 [Nostoc carneum NIES-2107]|nr:hypothetical protein NIES2107_50480 [Nostoc carneum NIES-2107]